MLLEVEPSGRLLAISRYVMFWRRLSEPRAVRLRKALEALGPIFVKFGQVLSTRRDLLPTDIADELARLQDRVPPFPSDRAIREIELALGMPVGELFAEFSATPVASASVAQVHFARLADGTQVAAHYAVAAGASVLFDAVCLLMSRIGAEALCREVAAVDFVKDAFVHCKFIGFSEGAVPLLSAAGVLPDADEGMVELASGAAEGFVDSCRRLRLWSRELGSGA